MTEPLSLDASGLYRVLSESIADGIVSIDENSTILSVNPAVEELVGYPAAELVGRPLTMLMPERFAAGHRAGVARYLSTGQRHIPWKGVSVPIRHRDGREIPVEISFGEFESAGRRVFSAVLRDISARIAAEAALAENALSLQSQTIELEQQMEEAQVIGEELEHTNQELIEANVALNEARRAAEGSAARVKEVLDSLSDAVSVFDRDWRWTYTNSAARAVLSALGKDPGEAIGAVLWELLPELEGTLVGREIRRAMETDTPVVMEEYFAPLGRWFEYRLMPSPGGLTTFTRDITEQRNAAEVLRSREAEYRALANSIPTLAWMARPDGWIFWYNDRWYEYTGTTPEQMAGWGWQSVHHPDTLPDVLEEWARSIRTGQPFEMTFPIKGADGQFRPFLTRVFPMLGADGEVARWFGTNADVSHEHLARRAAERAALRTRQLQSLTASLARARTLQDVATVVVKEAAAATGAATGLLAVRNDASDEALMLGEEGLPEAIKASYARFPLSRDTPSAECIRTGQPIYIAEREGPGGLLERYPALRDVWDTVGRNALAAVPLLAGNRAIACMSFTFDVPQEFDEDQREFFSTLAAQGAQAIQRVEAFDAERRERRRSESIVESITDGFATFDGELRFSYLNARASVMFGKPAHQLVGRAIHDLPHAGESPFTRLIQQVVEERRPRSLEGYGTIMGRWLDMRAYPAEDGGVIVYFQDITERRRQQDAAEFLAEASRVLTSSPDNQATLGNLARACVPRLGDWCAVDVLREDGERGRRLERVALVHENPDKLALATEYQLRYPPALDGTADALADALRGNSTLVPTVTDEMLTGNISDPRQLEMIQRLGLVSIIVVPLDTGREILGALTLSFGESGRHYDATDLRTAEDLANRAAVAMERSRLLERAEASNAAKTEFLRTVSHELRQPLNAIGGILSLWEIGLRGEVNELQAQDIARIKRNQQQLSSLIEDLLSFARLEAGKLETMQEPTSVNLVLEGLTAALSHDLESRGVDYHCALAPPELSVIGDVDRLHQILVNLVTNALKASSAGGRIDVWTVVDGDVVRIHVQDTGIGIPAHKLEEIFVPFVQVERALNNPRHGAGLGLAISRGLAEAMGGTLTAASVQGVGSTFTLTLNRSGEDRTAGDAAGV